MSGKTMALHRFTVGQRVEFVPGRFDGNVPRGAYTVLRLLPNDGADREYRVRNCADGHERVLRESQLRAGPADPMPAPVAAPPNGG
jgi:hypothetical protein